MTYDDHQLAARLVCCIVCRLEMYAVGAVRGLAWRHC